MINEIDFANQLAFNTIKNSPNVRATYNTLIPRFLRTNDNQKALKAIDLFKQNIGDDDYIKFYNGLYNYYNENYEKALEFFILSKSISGRFRTSGTVGFMNAHYFMQTLNKLNQPFEKLLDEGLSIIGANFDKGADSYNLHLQISSFYLLKKERDKAIEELEKSVQRGLRDKTILLDPAFDEIRDNDRFKLISNEIDIFVQREKMKFNEANLIPSI